MILFEVLFSQTQNRKHLLIEVGEMYNEQRGVRSFKK